MRNLLLFPNSKLLLRAEKNIIHAIHPGTGEVVATLRGHVYDIVSLSRSVDNVLHVLSCDCNGDVRVWDILDFKCVQVFTNTIARALFGAFLASEDMKLYRFTPTRTDLGCEKTSIAESKGDKIVGLAGGLDNRYIAIVFNEYIILHDSKKKANVELKHFEPLTCVAVHPTKHIIAAGDIRGRIIIWRRQNGKFDSDSVSTIWHWHSDAVGALDFSADGNYLLSGGEESVLVTWQVNTGKKTFLPRIGGPIECVAASVDGVYDALLTRNNILRVYDARTMQLTSKVVGLAASMGRRELPKALDDTYMYRNNRKTVVDQSRSLTRTGFVVEPATQHVVVQKVAGELQFYDMSKQCEVSTVDVAMKNTVSGNSVMHTVVERVAFSSNSHTRRMVTIETCNERSTLKFFTYDSTAENGEASKGKYVLTTQVNQPHHHAISLLLMHPNGRMAVTAADNGKFKVWALKPNSEEWFCKSVAFYRNEPILCGTLSQDGSVLVLACGSQLSVWDSQNNAMLTVLNYSSKIVKTLLFRQYLLATWTVEGDIQVYDMAHGVYEWSQRFKSITCCDTDGTQLLLVVENKKLVIFEDSAVPVNVIDLPADIVNSEVIACGRVGNDLYCFSRDGEFYPVVAVTNESVIAQFQEPKLGAYQLAVSGPTRKLESDSNVVLPIHGKKNTVGLEVLDAHPSYLLPPISKILENVFVDSESSNSMHSRKRLRSGDSNGTDHISEANGTPAIVISKKANTQSRAVISEIQLEELYHPDLISSLKRVF